MGVGEQAYLKLHYNKDSSHKVLVEGLIIVNTMSLGMQ